MPYTFTLANISHKTAIISFMRKHWGAPHPIVELDDFFNYYYAREDDKLNFALCMQKNGEIAALAGFIPSDALENPDIWVSIWVADKKAKGSGLELMAKMPPLTHCRTLSCNNIRPNTRAFYEFLGYTTARLSHFYRLAPNTQYKLAHVTQPVILPASGNARLVLLSNAEELRNIGFIPPQNANPYKDLAYIEKRYFNFPRQKYMLHAAYMPNAAAPFALVASRLNPSCGSAALRIVDYIGESGHLPNLGTALNQLLLNSGAEYADIYCGGIDAGTFAQAGFCERREEDELTIIPNYLNPLLCENTEYYYFTSNPQGFTMFKADGDQDRPNIIL